MKWKCRANCWSVSKFWFRSSCHCAFRLTSHSLLNVLAGVTSIFYNWALNIVRFWLSMHECSREASVFTGCQKSLSEILGRITVASICVYILHLQLGSSRELSPQHKHRHAKLSSNLIITTSVIFQQNWMHAEAVTGHPQQILTY